MPMDQAHDSAAAHRKEEEIMSTFTHAEIQYLNGQLLGRIATVGPHGRPHVMPVAVFYDPETESIVIGIAGDMAASKKFRDAQRRPDVAIVVDDLAAVDPWTPRGIEIRGRRRTPRTARRSASASVPRSRSMRRGFASARAGSWHGASTAAPTSSPRAT
jgi:PPOX class F420-dependent enzyme/OxyR family protein